MRRTRTDNHLVTRLGGLPLDGMLEEEPFQLVIKNNLKDSNDADHCEVRILHWATMETLVDFTIYFSNGRPIVHPEFFMLPAGIYAIDALYYDKHTRLAYDKYFLMFTIYPA